MLPGENVIILLIYSIDIPFDGVAAVANAETTNVSEHGLGFAS